MPLTVDQIIEHTLGIEGRYSNNPNDSGGETMWGITARVAREEGYHGPMKAMPRVVAIEIYRTRFFRKTGFDRVHLRSPAIAAELFDTGVNAAPRVAAEFLQQSLNALNNRGTHYPDLKVDGQLGPATLGALDAYLARRARQDGELVLLRLLNSLQAVFYVDLSQRRPKDEEFVFGWIRNRVVIL